MYYVQFFSMSMTNLYKEDVQADPLIEKLARIEAEKLEETRVLDDYCTLNPSLQSIDSSHVFFQRLAEYSQKKYQFKEQEQVMLGNHMLWASQHYNSRLSVLIETLEGTFGSRLAGLSIKKQRELGRQKFFSALLHDYDAVHPGEIEEMIVEEKRALIQEEIKSLQQQGIDIEAQKERERAAEITLNLFKAFEEIEALISETQKETNRPTAVQQLIEDTIVDIYGGIRWLLRTDAAFTAEEQQDMMNLLEVFIADVSAWENRGEVENAFLAAMEDAQLKLRAQQHAQEIVQRLEQELSKENQDRLRLAIERALMESTPDTRAAAQNLLMDIFDDTELVDALLQDIDNFCNSCPYVDAFIARIKERPIYQRIETEEGFIDAKSIIQRLGTTKGFEYEALTEELDSLQNTLRNYQGTYPEDALEIQEVLFDLAQTIEKREKEKPEITLEDAVYNVEKIVYPEISSFHTFLKKSPSIGEFISKIQGSEELGYPSIQEELKDINEKFKEEYETVIEIFYIGHGSNGIVVKINIGKREFIMKLNRNPNNRNIFNEPANQYEAQMTEEIGELTDRAPSVIVANDDYILMEFLPNARALRDIIVEITDAESMEELQTKEQIVSDEEIQNLLNAYNAISEKYAYADIHWRNILISNGKLYFIDFADTITEDRVDDDNFFLKKNFASARLYKAIGQFYASEVRRHCAHGNMQQALIFAKKVNQLEEDIETLRRVTYRRASETLERAFAEFGLEDPDLISLKDEIKEIKKYLSEGRKIAAEKARNKLDDEIMQPIPPKENADLVRSIANALKAMTPEKRQEQRASFLVVFEGDEEFVDNLLENFEEFCSSCPVIDKFIEDFKLKEKMRKESDLESVRKIGAQLGAAYGFLYYTEKGDFTDLIVSLENMKIGYPEEAELLDTIIQVLMENQNIKNEFIDGFSNEIASTCN